MELFIYNVDLEKVRCAIVTPRDNWSGQGLIGADICFGYLNKLPMRKRDMVNVRKAEKMKAIFGGLTSKRVPTQEGLSDDDDVSATDAKDHNSGHGQS